MEIAKIILEYLRVLIWPLIVICLAVSQKEAIRRLIDRIKQVSVLGTDIDTSYEPDTLKGKTEQVPFLSSGEESKTPAPDTSKKLDVLERDFNNFILSDLQSNRKILRKLADVLWKKHPGLVLFGKTPANFLDKVKTIGIDPKALEDLQGIEETIGKQSLTRKDIMQAYIKSKLLVDYFRGLATRR